MRKMIRVSLCLNVAVLVPVCGGLLLGMPWTEAVYGPASPARGILLAVYLAIASMSLGLLFHRQPLLVAPLLLVQVIYKLATPFTVGTLANPVILSNLAIAAVHAVTLVLIARACGSASATTAGAEPPLRGRVARVPAGQTATRRRRPGSPMEQAR